jgi:hypothetical protein
MFRFLISTLLFISCSTRYVITTPQQNNPAANAIPDYNELDLWAAHPWKRDPSDSVPAEIKNKFQDSIADVFFIHPTTYTGEKKDWNSDINDARLNAKTDNSSILYQATVFNQHARIFAPRYRQAHYSTFFVQSDAAKKAFDTAYADIQSAFEFYLENYHNDRPLIIAGHSQGALIAIRLLKDYFDNKALQKNLVAAYIIGWPIAQNVFSDIPVCNTPLQTGCFCGWRTFRVGYIPEYVAKETPSIVTNPLTWTTTDTYAPRELNKGSVLRDFNKIVPAVTDAQIEKSVLWSAKPRFRGSIFFTTPNYHIADINLFYMNIRENVEQRIYSFLKKN